jgi:glycosyltransferase involved in cell wall biosynthesis
LKRCSAERPGHSVYFLSFANQSEMPARYLTADLLALPSGGFYETWGLAVNEAMHMGVPALVSDRVGCQADLVTDGVTGWVFGSSDPDGLAPKLDQALETLANPLAAQAIKRAVTDRISGYTYSQTTQGLLKAVEAVRPT